MVQLMCSFNKVGLWIVTTKIIRLAERLGDVVIMANE